MLQQVYFYSVSFVRCIRIGLAYCIVLFIASTSCFSQQIDPITYYLNEERFDEALKTAKEIDGEKERVTLNLYERSLDSLQKKYDVVTKKHNLLRSEADLLRKRHEIAVKSNRFTRYVITLFLIGTIILSLVVTLISLYLRRRKLEQSRIALATLESDVLKNEVRRKESTVNQLSFNFQLLNNWVDYFSQQLKAGLDLGELEGKRFDRNLLLQIEVFKNENRNELMLSPELSDQKKQLTEKLKGFTNGTLTDNDLELLFMIHSGMSSGEIASVLGIEERSVEMRRYRVRKKIGIPSNESINEFLEAL